MGSLNKVMLIGNLGRDPEVRYTQSGTAVANFTMATTDRWKDPASGDFKERTEWHRIVVWGKQAEIAGEYLRKGRQVFVEGSLQTREWTDRDGNKRYTTEVRTQRFQMLGSRQDSGGGYQEAPHPGSDSSTQTETQTQNEPAFEDDDIPF